MAKDVFPQQVKNSLIKEGWKITHDPLTIRISSAVKLQIDLAAESTIAAERDSEKIAYKLKALLGTQISAHFILHWGNILTIAKHLKNKNQIELFT